MSFTTISPIIQGRILGFIALIGTMPAISAFPASGLGMGFRVDLAPFLTVVLVFPTSGLEQVALQERAEQRPVAIFATKIQDAIFATKIQDAIFATKMKDAMNVVIGSKSVGTIGRTQVNPLGVVLL